MAIVLHDLFTGITLGASIRGRTASDTGTWDSGDMLGWSQLTAIGHTDGSGSIQNDGSWRDAGIDGITTDDMSIYATWSTWDNASNNAHHSLCLRSSSGSGGVTYYYCQWFSNWAGGGYWNIGKYVGGTQTWLGSAVTYSNSTYKGMGLKVEGTTITAYMQQQSDDAWVEVGSQTDSAISGGGSNDAAAIETYQGSSFRIDEVWVDDLSVSGLDLLLGAVSAPAVPGGPDLDGTGAADPIPLGAVTDPPAPGGPDVDGSGTATIDLGAVSAPPGVGGVDILHVLVLNLGAVTAPPVPGGPDLDGTGSGTLDAGAVSSPPAVAGLDIDANQIMDLGAVPAPPAVGGLFILGTGMTIAVTAGSPFPPLAVPGIDLTESQILDLGAVSAPAAIGGMDLAGTGSGVFDLGSLPVPPSVGGIDFSLGLGIVLGLIAAPPVPGAVGIATGDVTPPGPITNLVLSEVVGGTIQVDFNMPSDPDTTGFTARYIQGSGYGWVDITDGTEFWPQDNAAPGAPVSLSVPGFSPGLQYEIAVFARDQAGNWNTPVVDSIWMTQTPAAPTITSLTEPSNDGHLFTTATMPVGANIAGYRVRWQVGVSPSWPDEDAGTEFKADTGAVGGAAVAADLAGFSPGADISVAWFAYNDVGLYSPAAAQHIQTYAPDTTPPAAPQLQISEPIPGAGTIRAVVDAPADSDTAAVKVRWQTGTGNSWPDHNAGNEFAPETASTPSQQHVFDRPGFSPSTQYEVTAWARDHSGNWSSYDDKTITTGAAPTLPGAPDQSLCPVPLRRGV